MGRKRVFVSGGAGVIGTALVNKLLEEGADIYVGDLLPCPEEWRGRLKYRRGDLNTISKRELGAFSPEFFFHLAATFERTDETPGFYKENFHHNIALSHHLLECLQGSSSLQKIIFASSYLVYDPALYLFETPQIPAVSLHEDDALRPRNLCGAAKLFHETELSFFQQLDVPSAMARIFRVYGKKSRDVISRWVRQALRGEPLKIFLAENRFDYIFADDVAEGLLQLAENEVTGVVNLGTGYARSISEVISVLDKNIPNIKKEYLPADHAIFESSQAEMSRFVEHTGWCAPHTIEEAIPKLIEYEKERLQVERHEAELSVPEKRGVLVTSISKKVPLIQSLRNAAQKVGFFESIHGADLDPLCIARSAVDYFWEMPMMSHITPEILLDYCRHHGILAIVPTRDGELEFFAQCRDWFAEHGIGVMISNVETVRICLDKLQFADWLMENDFSAIPTSTSIAAIADYASSYVVKECYGAGSLSIGLDLSLNEAEAHAKELSHPIFQPYIAGLEYSVDIYRDHAKKIKGCVARRRDRVVQGESQITTTERKLAIEVLCKRIADALDLYGHAVFQVIETPDQALHVVECNPRFGGASTASVAAGLDSFYWFLLECSGESLENYPFERFKGEIRQIRYAADKIIAVSKT
jgi:carbamoyl-phosphate synthase large subunit